MNWLASFIGAVQRLADLLDCEFLPNSSVNQMVIGRMAYSTILFHNNGDFEARDQHILRLHFLVKHLGEVRAKNVVVFDSLKRDMMRKDKSNPGIQFEVEMAASVLRKGLIIEKTERPDFRISFRDQFFGLECSSAQFNSGSNKDALQKIIGVVRKKRKLRYCNNKAVLLINVSSLYHSQNFPTREVIESNLKNQLNKKDYGSVLLFYVVSIKEIIQSVYMRFDHNEVDPILKELLDQLWPKGRHALGGHFAHEV